MRNLCLGLLILFCWNSIGLAGQRDTHGGGGIVCRDKQGNITSVELLDLWEAKHVDHIKKFQQFKGTNYGEILDEMLSYIGTKVTATYLLKLKSYRDNIFRHIKKHHDSEVAIAPPEDAKNSLVKRGCSIEGVAIFQEYYHPELGSYFSLLIDSPLFNLLPEYHKAALFLHEIVYKLLRDEVAVQNSILARYIVGTFLDVSNAGEFFSSKTYICRDRFGENSFYVGDWSMSNGKVSMIYLVNAYSETVQLNTYKYFEDLKLADFMKIKPPFTFHLLGRGLGSKITFKHRDLSDVGDDPHYVGWNVDTERDFETIKCYEVM